jgi:hypothetical protein
VQWAANTETSFSTIEKGRGDSGKQREKEHDVDVALAAIAATTAFFVAAAIAADPAIVAAAASCVRSAFFFKRRQSAGRTVRVRVCLAAYSPVRPFVCACVCV